MADLNPTFIQALNTGVQNLFTIENNAGVPRYISGGSSAVVKFSELAANINTAASMVASTGQLTLSDTTQTSQTFLITSQLVFTGNTPASFKLVNSATGVQHGLTVPASQTLQVSVAPTSTSTYQVVLFTDDRSDFVYPNQIKTAILSVQAVAGYPNGA
jgi:hypothetical protein